MRTFGKAARRFLRRRPAAGDAAPAIPLKRATLSADPALIYAIGDVHGCIGKLLALEEKIWADAANRPGPRLIVMLGDYVDRGPDSAAVLDHLLKPPPEGFYRLCLRGNHDDLLRRLVQQPDRAEAWLEFAGEETIFSYGYDLRHLARRSRRRDTIEAVERFAQEFPPEHLDFLDALPVSLTTGSYFFAHAGARPGTALDAQSERDLMWIREPFIAHEGAAFDRIVVHGHTPANQAFVSRYRIGIDTAAYMGGPLSAVRLTAEDAVILQS